MIERPWRRLLTLGVLVASCWLASRALVVWLLLGPQTWVRGDLGYFAASLAALPHVGLADTLVEYPLPGVVVIALPWLFVHLVGAPGSYDETVIAFSMVADAVFMVLLVCYAGRTRRAALIVWLLAVPALGATTYARFDLVPGILAGVALLLLHRHPRVAAGSAALATGLKLWPALVLPALAAPASTRRLVVRVVAVTGAVLATAIVVVAGWGRLVSPLTWQAERGLQIESVAATPAMVGWALSRADYTVAFTEHHAYEVAGPGTKALLQVSGIASLLLVPLLLWLWALALRRGRDVTIETVAWLALTAVGAFMVTSKVLSPQYMLWLLPLAAAAVAVAQSRALRAWAALLLVATAATQVVFPVLYGQLTLSGDHAWWAVLALAVRNLLLVVLVVWAAVHAVRGVSQLEARVRESSSTGSPG